MGQNGQKNASSSPEKNLIEIGIGKADITGVVYGLGMMGYATPAQTTYGILNRLWSRAYLMKEASSATRMVFVCAEICFITQAIKLEVIKRLQKIYGDLYTADNVMLSGTHTHNGPGGYSHYTLYNITIFGFSKENFNLIVNGICESIRQAHESIVPGYVLMNTGHLRGIAINRSPGAYESNPDHVHYEDRTNTLMTVLKFVKEDGEEMGMIDWYAIHPTCVSKNNRYITGDSKGYAAHQFEKIVKQRRKGEFIAAFANSEHADTSPNVRGIDQGEGKDEYESCEICGEKQFRKGMELYEQATEILDSQLDYRHQWVKMPGLEVRSEFTGDENQILPSSAIGMSFAAGASNDGASKAPGFLEGMRKGESWFSGQDSLTEKTVKTFLTVLNQLNNDPKHFEKPIALPTGKMKPYPWTPQVLPFQLFKIGQLAIVSVPGEMTTMSGRHLKQRVLKILEKNGVTHAVIAGLANTYTGYIVTKEAYTHQRYEAASTHFGPYTLSAYQQIYSELAEAMIEGKPTDHGVVPPQVRPILIKPEIKFEFRLSKKGLGKVINPPSAFYQQGEIVRVVFKVANPNLDQGQQNTYLKVEHHLNHRWESIATDTDWETRIKWYKDRTNFLAEILWRIPSDTPAGEYRIVYLGHYRKGLDKFEPYEGMSQSFQIKLVV